MNNHILEKIEAMKQLKGPAYKPRTKHLSPDGWAKYTNRLFLEASPYLIQHAHNPVNWYPWGKEAFETARSLNRPVLLSVGYSTCHWCHVMEEESFEDEEIALYLNKNFIAIKVDREERPDIDAVYMSAVQAITGGGGWPMNIWLTPDKKPFYGGTYFPARDGDRPGAPGFYTLLRKLNDFYKTDGEKVIRAGQEIMAAINKMPAPAPGTYLPDKKPVDQAINFYKEHFDNVYGGLSGAPKFPSTLPIRLLLRQYHKTGDKVSLFMAEQTLEKMAGGGIYDHAGGGFHRYAIDEQWLVPHFEKMLYDNALLVKAYLEGYQVTGNEAFKRVTEEILAYVKKDMAAPDGAFYAATDADSLTPKGRREEGYFFTWTPEELETVLGKEKADIVKHYYAVGPIANFEGRYILHTPNAAEDTATAFNISLTDLNEIVETSKEKLYTERQNRPAPLRDEKIIVSWNGLMISAYAFAGLVLQKEGYTKQAENAAQFIMDNLFKDERLHRSFKDSISGNKAYLADYAFFIAGLLDLFESGSNIKWLETAIKLDDILKENYEDHENGGFFRTGKDQEALITREKPSYDGAIPSGNAVAIMNLLRLGRFTTKAEYIKRAEKAMKAFLGVQTPNPVAMSEMLLAVDYYLDKPREIIIVTPDENNDAGLFLDIISKQFLPSRIIDVVSEGNDLESHNKILPLIKGKTAIDGKITVYVCEAGVCKLPTTDPEMFRTLIRSQK